MSVHKPTTSEEFHDAHFGKSITSFHGGPGTGCFLCLSQAQTVVLRTPAKGTADR